jgi:hypothetical protein
MTTEDESRRLFDEIADDLAGRNGEVRQSKMFGMPGIMVSRKAFAGYFNGDMTFKLSGEAHARALALSGAQIFDPTGRGRGMKEWVQVPAKHAAMWPELAQAALDYVDPTS